MVYIGPTTTLPPSATTKWHYAERDIPVAKAVPDTERTPPNLERRRRERRREQRPVLLDSRTGGDRRRRRRIDVDV